VFEARGAELQRALGGEGPPVADEPTAARALYEAQRLGLWRAGRFTGFDAWVEAALGMASAQARELAEREALARGDSLDRLPEQLVALWLRAEAALLRSCPAGRVTIVGDGALATLELRLPATPPQDALRGLEELGRAAGGLMRLLPAGRSRGGST
jgi:hypothetical protein